MAQRTFNSIVGFVSLAELMHDLEVLQIHLESAELYGRAGLAPEYR
jgi:hypothetical protein